MNRLVVRYQCTSRENLGHKRSPTIGLCLRIQNLYTHYQCRFNIHPIVKLLFEPLCRDCGAWVVSSDP